ncbi:MAG: ArsC family (seleno)protein [Candidatus Rokuibacteriota bacterium]
MTCKKTQGFLAKQCVDVESEHNAKKDPIKGRAALRVLENVDELHVTKGKRVVRVDLRKQRPSSEGLLALLLGPSGNLRAPTVRRGRTLIVGFDDATYRALLD